MPALILIRGGGDLASGVALRLHRAGLNVLISELPQPLAVRRAVSFAEAVYAGSISVEGVTGRFVKREQVWGALEAGEIPVIIDPDASILAELAVQVVVDARITKHPPVPLQAEALFQIGLGPGFHAGRDCQAVVETRRGHTLGRVYWDGKTLPDSGLPDGDPRRVLRAPVDGHIVGYAHIGDHVQENQIIAKILALGTGKQGSDQVQPALESQQGIVRSPFKGVLRGLIRPGIQVSVGLKIGDVDPRDDRQACFLVSDKALAIGGGVLEAILSQGDIRKKLWI